MNTLGKLCETPNKSTEDNPFLTSGVKCSIILFIPNLETPGILSIGCIASSSSL